MTLCVFQLNKVSNSSNSSIPKNPANSNKHVNKNLKSGIVEFSQPYFVTKGLDHIRSLSNPH